MRQCAIVEKGGEVVSEICWWLPTDSPAVNLLLFYVTFLGTVLVIAWLHTRLRARATLNKGTGGELDRP